MRAYDIDFCPKCKLHSTDCECEQESASSGNSDVVTRRVVCAACRYCDTIIAGARHFDKVMISQIMAMPRDKRPRGSQWEQGFIDQFGTFMTRREAMIVAKQAGQIIDIERGCGGNSNVLFSEGLY